MGPVTSAKAGTHLQKLFERVASFPSIIRMASMDVLVLCSCSLFQQQGPDSAITRPIITSNSN